MKLKKLKAALLSVSMLASYAAVPQYVPSSALFDAVASAEEAVSAEAPAEAAPEEAAPEEAAPEALAEENDTEEAPAMLCSEITTVLGENLGDMVNAAEGFGFSFFDITGASATDKYYDQLDEDSQSVYNAMYDYFKSGPSTVSVGATVTVFGDISDLGISETWENVAITIDKTTNTFDISDEGVYEEMNEWYGNICSAAFLALVYDHPEMSWIVGCQYGSQCSISALPDAKTGTATVTATIAAIYAASGESVSNTGTAAENIAAVTAAADAVASRLKNNGFTATKDASGNYTTSASPYDTVKEIHDYICETVTYASGDLSPRIYQTAYSALAGNKITVCAGYAKSFKLVCDRYGIPCVLIRGKGVTSQTGPQGENHAWDYVKLDGAWYAVDCTWDDQKTTTYYDFFLTGSDTVDEHFGKKKFSENHLPNGVFGSEENLVFSYPALSADKYVQGAAAAGVAINKENFPDDVFRKYVSDNFDDGDGVLSEEEIAAVIYIYVGGTNEKNGGVESFEGVEYFTELTNLNCSYNQLTELDVSKNAKLTYLNCDNNQLTELDVIKNTALIEFHCSGNQLTELNISNNTELTIFECRKNQLTELDTSKNTRLYAFGCNDNKLTKLDVSKNTKLELFDCHNNKLTSLDVSKNTFLILSDFRADNNSYEITIANGAFSLSELEPNGFNASKASNWKGAEYDKTTNTLKNITGDTVTYDYDCGNDTTVTFTLKVTNPHTHAYGTAWKTDGTNHWHECECGEKSDLAAHKSVSADNGKAATCTEDGVESDTVCSVCGITLTKGEKISAKGHTIVADAAVSPTCTEKGKTEGSHCSVCGTVLKEQTELPANGHKQSEWITDKEATPIAEGSKHIECTVCGEIIKTEKTDKLAEEEHFDDKNEKEETVSSNPAAKPEDSITSITINPAFNMKHKDDETVELDITNIKVKAREIYDDADKIAKAEEALGIDVNPNKHYNLLDLTLWKGDEDISDKYTGLVKVIIPIPAGHADKEFICYRITETKDGVKKEIIDSVREGSNIVIYLEHFSEYALVEADSGAAVSGKITSGGAADVETTVELIDSDKKVVETVKGTDAYSFANVAAGTYTLRVSKTKHCTREYNVTVSGEAVEKDVVIALYGDIDGDGNIAIKDALQIVNYRNSKPSSFDKVSGDDLAYLEKLADANADNKVNINDALQIVNYRNSKKSAFDDLP